MMCISDDNNGIPSFKYGGLSIVMGNKTDDVTDTKANISAVKAIY